MLLCTEDVILLCSDRAKQAMTTAHQPLQCSPIVCWYSQSPSATAGLCSPSACTFSGPGLDQGTEKALGLPGAALHLPLATGWVGLWDKGWLFNFRGAHGMGCFGSQSSYHRTRCVLPAMDGSPPHLILPQKHCNVLAIFIITLPRRDAP